MGRTFQVAAGLKGMWGAVWWMTVKVLIQKWYCTPHTHVALNQYFAIPNP